MRIENMTTSPTGLRPGSCNALVSGGTRSRETGKTALHGMVVFVALLFLFPLAIEQAFGSNCENSHRLPLNQVDCLHAWWDNTPPPSTGVSGGSTYGAQSFCSGYGDVVTKIDIRHAPDRTITLSNSSKWKGSSAVSDVNTITCCADKSDLCLKTQVEHDDGFIAYYDVSDAAFESVDVRTHEKRYNFCQEHSDAIYCEIDPENDANIPLICGNRDCTLGDCNWHWDRSDAADTCRVIDMTFDGSNLRLPKCTVSTLCENADQTRGRNSTITVNVWQVDDLQECDLELKLSC